MAPVAGTPGYNGEYAADANIIIAATVRQSAISIHIRAAAAEAAQGIEQGRAARHARASGAELLEKARVHTAEKVMPDASRWCS